MKTLIALLLLLAPLAQATDVTLNWTAPAANADGSKPAVVGGYNIYVAGTDAALSTMVHTPQTLSVGNVLTYTYKNVAPGNYVYAITTWYCVPPTTWPCTESAQ